MDLGTVRQALKDAISEIDGLNVDDLRDTPNVPCAMVFPETPMSYHEDFDDAVRPQFCVTILVAYNDTSDAQAQMDEYLSLAGTKSVKAAIELDDTLGGVVSACTVNELRSYGVMSLNDGGVRYLSAELTVQVYS